jgi:hypothetical protein
MKKNIENVAPAIYRKVTERLNEDVKKFVKDVSEGKASFNLTEEDKKKAKELSVRLSENWTKEMVSIINDRFNDIENKLRFIEESNLLHSDLLTIEDKADFVSKLLKDLVVYYESDYFNGLKGLVTDNDRVRIEFSEISEDELQRVIDNDLLSLDYLKLDLNKEEYIIEISEIINAHKTLVAQGLGFVKNSSSMWANGNLIEEFDDFKYSYKENLLMLFSKKHSLAKQSLKRNIGYLIDRMSEAGQNFREEVTARVALTPYMEFDDLVELIYESSGIFERLVDKYSKSISKEINEKYEKEVILA